MRFDFVYTSDNASGYSINTDSKSHRQNCSGHSPSSLKHILTRGIQKMKRIAIMAAMALLLTLNLGGLATANQEHHQIFLMPFPGSLAKPKA